MSYDVMLRRRGLRITAIVGIANHASGTRSRDVAGTVALLYASETVGTNAESIIATPVSI